MVALGGYCTATGVISIDYLEQALPDVLPERAHKLIPKNIEALRAGASRVS
jgi:2-oxoglutarate ferredoxin oxidoreductase subunit gamma